MIWLRRGMTIDGVHLDRWQAEEVYFEARRIAREEGRLRWWPTLLIAGLLAFPITCMCWPLTLAFLTPAHGVERAALLGVFVGGAIALIAGPASVIAFRVFHHRDLRRAMGTAGHPMCSRCGYSFRGLPAWENRCPECGAQREPMPGAKS